MRLWIRDRCKSCGAVRGSDDNRWNCPMMRGTYEQRKRSWRRPNGECWRRPKDAPFPDVYTDIEWPH